VKITHQGPTTLSVLHDRGGAIQRRMVELAAAQAAAGHEVRILSAESADSVTEHRGFVVQGVRVRTRRPVRDYEMLLATRKHLRANRPDVLHFHGVPDGARFTTFLQIPTLLHLDYFRFRGANTRLGHRYYEGSFGRFNRVLPDSESCAAEFRQFWGTPAPIEVIHEGVNVDQFRPDPESGERLRAELGLDGVIMLYVGRLCDQKGTDVLLDVWQRCPPSGATLMLAGPIGQFGRDQPGKLPERMKSIGVLYIGAIEERRLADVYNACDVFVMPTVRDEMFGMAALEAQACGKPVVASRLGGLVESVSNRSGLFVPPSDPCALQRALTELAGDPERRAEMGAAARQHALGFTWDRMAAKVQSVYEAIT